MDTIIGLFQAATLFDYVLLVVGLLCVILGIAQLCTKKGIGIGKIDTFTKESVRTFSVVSSVIYILGGIVTAAAPFAVKYINSQSFDFSIPTSVPNWILTGVILLVFVAQFAILKKKH